MPLPLLSYGRLLFLRPALIENPQASIAAKRDDGGDLDSPPLESGQRYKIIRLGLTPIALVNASAGGRGPLNISGMGIPSPRITVERERWSV